jgi:Xaa-Pro aminopeptidase
MNLEIKTNTRLFYQIILTIAKKNETFFIIIVLYNPSMHLITNPSDIYYLTGVRPHDPGEILLISQIQNTKGKIQNGGIVFCDARTSALFDTRKYEIIDDRKKWGETFKIYPELDTDPDFLTQTLREKIEKYGVKLQMKKSPVTEQRIVKTPEEIQKLRTSQEMNKKVYEQILPFLIP